MNRITKGTLIGEGVMNSRFFQRVASIIRPTRGDIDAAFGLLFDGLSKVLASTGILLTVRCPRKSYWAVFSPVSPWPRLLETSGTPWKRSVSQGREEGPRATAQPYGVGSGQVFGWLFLIIGPVYWQTGDAILAWRVGVAAGFLGGVVELLGAYIGPWVIRALPRAALLGNLAAGALVWLSVVGMLHIYDRPLMAVVPFFIVMLSYVGSVRMPFGLSAGVVAITVGAFVAWISGAAQLETLQAALGAVSVYPPVLCVGDVVIGLRSIGPYLQVILPLQIANSLTTLQGLESAAVAGDPYPVRTSMIADGVGTVIGALLGNPFPTTVYYGHPAWKEIGAGSAYSIVNGCAYLLLGCSGAVAIMAAVVPFQVVMPILVIVGITMSVQAITVSEEAHIGAIMIAFIPLIAQYVETAVNAALSAAGTTLATLGTAAFPRHRCRFRGSFL